ncbi:MAG: hypothetical protein Q8M07_12570 [Prosthecobacter sp.]|nr:hypothetical protein [Prosthecobacter sp.]
MDVPISTSQLELLGSTAAMLRGKDRRLFMGAAVKAHGRGAAHYFHQQLGWDPTTMRKGLREVQTGIVCQDAFDQRGRKAAEARLINLEEDLRTIGEGASQTDPTFRTTQLYRRLTAKEARRQLIEDFGYKADTVPSERSLRRKLSALGFKPRRVAKSKPLRKVPQTDAIFEAVHHINKQADADPGIIRLSIDTKTTVPLGNLSRGGKSRQGHQALDHDLQPEAKLTPFGLHRPDTAETWLCFSTGSVTADFMADRLNELWPALKKTILLRIPL